MQGVAMPWFPDFVSAVELARRQTRVTGQADPVAEYFSVLQTGAARELETVWPGDVVIYDPRAGEVRGHHHLKHFVRENQSLWAERHASVETIASTTVGRRAVVELLVTVRDFEANEVAWPIAVVAESPDDLSSVFRTYCSQWPVDGRRHLRPPILKSGDAYPGDVVGRFLAAVEEGDAQGVLGNFEADGYLREPIGPHATHRGDRELRAYFAARLDGGGVRLEHCVLTEDGTRSALEYNCVRWGGHDLPPQAGIGVFERSQGGLLKAVRFYDDIAVPGGHPT
jgi:ketosteroid isomerase-like protein